MMIMKKIICSLGLAMLCSVSVLMAGSNATRTISFAILDQQEYIGTYRMSDLPFEKVVVTEQAGKLHYVAGEYEGDFVLVSGKADTYSANGNALITFLRNTEGKVEKMKLEVEGGVFVGKKETLAPDLNHYVGKYKMANLPFEFIVLSLKNDQLYIEAGDNEGTLTPLTGKKDAFDAGGQATIKFERDSLMKVSKMLVEAQGQVFEGTPVAK
jgi:hypothetical protein